MTSDTTQFSPVNIKHKIILQTRLDTVVVIESYSGTISRSVIISLPGPGHPQQSRDNMQTCHLDTSSPLLLIIWSPALPATDHFTANLSPAHFTFYIKSGDKMTFNCILQPVHSSKSLLPTVLILMTF